MKISYCPSIVLGILFTVTTSQAALINGSFETGDFSGWVIRDSTPNVLGGHGVQVQTGGATDGIYAASSYGFSLELGISFAQDVGILGASSTLSFDYSAFVNSFDLLRGTDRVFSVTLSPRGGGIPIHTFEIWRGPFGQSTSSGAQSVSLDLSAYVGLDARVSFDQIGKRDDGASSFTFDNVRLQPTPVPEPATYALTIGACLVGFAVWHRRSSKAQS